MWPLCDAVLQTTRSAETLAALERSNGFVVPLDRRGEWYRYHHLFGELLRNELERSEPEMLHALNRRAMEWCIANDLTEAAVVYGHAAGETDTVAGLLDSLALPLYYDGRMDTLEEWLAWFDEDDSTHYPALAVCGAWVRLLTGRPAEAERWLALAEGATSRDPPVGWQCHDRAVGRHPASGLDAATGSSGRSPTPISRSITVAPERLEAGRARWSAASRTRCSGRWRLRSPTSWPRLTPGSRSALSTSSTSPTRSSRCSRPSAETGTRRRDARARHKRTSTIPASATTRRARSCT